MKKNDVIIGDITAYGCEGEGILKTEGVTVFVPFALKGERVEVLILKCTKNIAFGKLLRVITPSKMRVAPECSVFMKCGGCSLLHMDYGEQLEYKRSLIAETLEKIAFIKTTPLETAKSQPRLGYRAKLALPVRSENGQLKIGFFAPNSHRVVATDECLLHGEWAKGAIACLKNYINKYKISAYDEKSGLGAVRHLVVKKIGDEFIVILIASTLKLIGIEYFSEELKKTIGQHSLYINQNTQKNNVILGDKFSLISGSGYILGEWRSLKYKIGPQSFMQVNESVKNELYSDAISFSGENQIVIDAYCGAGLLTCALAKNNARAIGIEIVAEAVDLARELAKENGVNNAEFICAPCENALPPLIEKIKTDGKNATVYLDPPRKGLDGAVIKALLKAEPEKIVYISCSPQTLARDLGLILGTLKFDNEGGVVKATEKALVLNESEAKKLNGYVIEYLRGYDMFACCKGVETLCVLKKVKNA